MNITERKGFASGSTARPLAYSGAWVRARIDASGFSITDFAARLGVSRVWVHVRLRAGCTTLDAYAINALAEGQGPEA
ncbi:MAG: hypothetical protein COA84_07615 [Robiginitomaculum sp.]|nr:MAG: hypothetical protein COA84_07615 [Robiginitomaculum sp.]